MNWRFLVGVGLVGGCGKGAPSVVDRTAEAVAAVAAGLRPPVVIQGAPEVVYRLADRMSHYHVPGVSVAVVDSGRMVWATGFGVKEAGTADSVSAATIFQAASISKPVAATAMLRLVEAGKLSLDTAVNVYLTSWQLPSNQFTAKQAVTLRRVVSHSAGLTISGFPGYKAGDSVPTVPQVLDGTKPANTGPVRVDVEPGKIMRYAGGGTTIMQLVLTDVTGESFPALMKRLVIDPIGMTSSTYEQPLPESRWAESAAAHEADGIMTPGRAHTYPEMAAAGLWTTPTDLLKWAMEIAAARAGTSTKVLSTATAIEMLTVQKASAGLGPFLDGAGRGFNFGHTGGNHGFRCEVIYFPETGQGAAVMTNGEQGIALVKEILYSIAAHYRWPEYGPRSVSLVALDSVQLERYVGTYEAAKPFPVLLVVSREGGKLFAEAKGLLPREEFGLTTAEKSIGFQSGSEGTFLMGPGGKVLGVEFSGNKLMRKAK